jgi:hypothetical protein
MTLQTIEQATASSFAFRNSFHEKFLPGRPGADAELPEYEQIGFAELIEALTEFNAGARDIERQSRAALGPARFCQLKELLFHVWESDRMI